MKARLGLGSLESRIYMIFTLMIFVAVFIMQLVSFRFTINALRSSTLENNRTLLGQLVTQIDSYISGMEQISQAVQDDPEIIEYMLNGANSGSPSYLSIQQRLGNYIKARNDISDIIIIGRDGLVITADPDSNLNPWTSVSEKDWYLEAMDAGGQTVVSSSYVQNLVEGRYSWVVSLSREILSVDKNESLGVMLVDLKFNRIKELCQSLVVGRKGYNFIIDSDRNYIFHPTQQLVYSNIRSEPIDSIYALLKNTEDEFFFADKKYFMIETSDITGWFVVSVTHESDIVTDWRYVQISYSLLGLILFLIVGLATNRISSGITKPVRKLQDIMKSVDTGEFRLVGSIRATDEIKELAREYDTMVGHIRNLMEANTREQELKRKSDLKALQAQINPHFLYNTLDSIIWMGEMGQNKEVVLMTSALSKLFRISISKGREIIKITDEIAHVESYLTIQKMRYKDKFEYSIDIDPDLYTHTILKITLQPLVENAIYHGIKEVDHKGLIQITGEELDGNIKLEVVDNGKGMTTEELEELNQNLDTSSNSHQLSQQGMGVRNVHERIQLYFGKEYGLSYISTPGSGTRITVLIPSETLEA
ncbi:MAG: sensor histidine kinase [Spirochaetia bacterium]|nr:sensor histidine kinase [Spirochaetia bacterium]